MEDYICENCGHLFDEPKRYVDKHNLDTPPYEEYLGCPKCGSVDYDEAVVCHRCGEIVAFSQTNTYGEELYCENCYDEMFE